MASHATLPPQSDAPPADDPVEPVASPRGGMNWPGVAELGQQAVFLVVCFVALRMHQVLYQSSGAFWRDECSSILLAGEPTWHGLWSNLATDSFPALFVGTLRLWITSGLGGTDAGIRLLGIGLSLGMLASLALSCRALGVRVPVLALGLVVFNRTVLYFGSSVRAYGLAALLIVACFAAFWRLVAQPTRGRAAAAFALALLSIHSNYQDCYLLFGIGTAAAAVCLLAGQWKRSVLVLALCFVAALTMLVYLRVIANYRDAIVLMREINLAGIVERLVEALANDNPLVLCIWLALGSGVAVVCVVGAMQARGNAAPREPSLPLYCLLTVAIGGGVGTLFLLGNGMAPFGWHFLPLVVLAAAAVDCGIQYPRYATRIVLAKGGAVCLLGLLCFPMVWGTAQMRRGNMDLIAATLQQETRPGDLVLVNPFWLQPSFRYYYHGSAAWQAVPVVAGAKGPTLKAGDTTIKRQMIARDAIGPTLAIIEETLRAGHRVWIVGGIELPPPGEPPPESPSVPDHTATHVWSMQIGYFLRSHAAEGNVAAIPLKQPLGPLESPPLVVFAAWRP